MATQLIVFGVGISNFGAARDLDMPTLPKRVNDEFGDRFTVLAQYGATGNLLVSALVCPEEVAAGQTFTPKHLWVAVEVVRVWAALVELGASHDHHPRPMFAGRQASDLQS